MIWILIVYHLVTTAIICMMIRDFQKNTLKKFENCFSCEKDDKIISLLEEMEKI
jgi:hypothetical protein